MNLHDILVITSILVEIVAIVFAVLHFLSESKKRKRNPHSVKIYHPTFPIIILTLVFSAVLIFLILNNRNQKSLEVIRTYWWIIETGILLTIAVSLISIVLGTVMGTFAALVITRRKGMLFSTLIDSPIMSLMYVLLGIPALVLLYLTYYSGIQSIFWSAVIALSINLSPFVAKIVSASIRNISPEQIDSAIAFGYSPRQITKYFKIGFVIRTSLQPLLVEYYTTIKLSSFAGLIGLTEIYHASQEIIRGTQDPITSYTVLAGCYVFIVTPFAILADYLEQKSKKVVG
jgi:polar amino acid transport system permease protein